MSPLEEKTRTTAHKFILASLVIYLLAGLACAVEEEMPPQTAKAAITCLLCRILQITSLIWAVIFTPLFTAFTIIAVILARIYRTSPEENKRKQHSKIGLIITAIILTLLMLPTIILIILPYLIFMTTGIQIPNIIEILGGCERVCNP